MGFKLKSGNQPSFKSMGSSPLKANADEMREAGVSLDTIKAAHGTRSYDEAYSKRDMDTYGNLNQDEYTAEAKRQSKSYKDTGKWDAPKEAMKGSKPAKGTKVVDGKTVNKGLGANKGKTLTPEAKAVETAKRVEIKENISAAKDSGDKNARDEAQMALGESRAGGDDAKTGTVVSRAAGKVKAKVNDIQLKARAKRANKKAVRAGRKAEADYAKRQAEENA